MAPRNHEFNFGVDRLQELNGMMNFPLLAANVKTSDGKNLFQSYEIFSMKEIKVGVFGLITPETKTKVDSRIVAGLTFESPVDTAVNMVKELKKEKCDIIIAVTHLGVDEATILANKSEALAFVEGLDVVIDGHSHTVFKNGKTTENTLIVQAGEYGENIGVVNIDIENGTVSKTTSLVKIPTSNEGTQLPSDEGIVAAIATLQNIVTIATFSIFHMA